MPGASAIYLFNEGAGTVLHDYSGNGYHGTLGAAGAAPTWTPYGLSFDGGDYATIGTAAALDLGNVDHTLICIFTPTGVSGSQSLMGKLAYSNTSHFGLYLNGNAPSYRCCVNGGTTVNVSGGTIAAGTPVMVTATRAGTEIRVYIDAAAGTPGTAADGTIASGALNFRIGTRASADGQFLTGGVHAAAVYPYALAPAQIAQEVDAFRPIMASRGVALA